MAIVKLSINFTSIFFFLLVILKGYIAVSWEDPCENYLVAGKKGGLKHGHRAICMACNYTTYRGLCAVSLFAYHGSKSASPTKLTSMALKLATRSAMQTYEAARTLLLSSDRQSNIETQAIQDCMGLMSECRDELSNSSLLISKLRGSPYDIHGQIQDALVFTSAALTYHSTCSDGLNPSSSSNSSTKTNSSSSIFSFKTTSISTKTTTSGGGGKSSSGGGASGGKGSSSGSNFKSSGGVGGGYSSFGASGGNISRSGNNSSTGGSFKSTSVSVSGDESGNSNIKTTSSIGPSGGKRCSVGNSSMKSNSNMSSIKSGGGGNSSIKTNVIIGGSGGKSTSSGNTISSCDISSIQRSNSSIMSNYSVGITSSTNGANGGGDNDDPTGPSADSPASAMQLSLDNTGQMVTNALSLVAHLETHLCSWQTPDPFLFPTCKKHKNYRA